MNIWKYIKSTLVFHSTMAIYIKWCLFKRHQNKLLKLRFPTDVLFCCCYLNLPGLTTLIIVLLDVMIQYVWTWYSNHETPKGNDRVDSCETRKYIWLNLIEKTTLQTLSSGWYIWDLYVRIVMTIWLVVLMPLSQTSTCVGTIIWYDIKTLTRQLYSWQSTPIATREVVNKNLFPKDTQTTDTQCLNTVHVLICLW